MHYKGQAYRQARSLATGRVQSLPRLRAGTVVKAAVQTTAQRPAVAPPVVNHGQSVANNSPSAPSDNNNGLQPHRVYVFDPNQPGSVKEISVQPHADTIVAEQLLQSVNAHGVDAAEASGIDGRRVAVPLRALANANTSQVNGQATSVARVLARPGQQYNNIVPGGTDSEALRKSGEVQRQLVAQVEKQQQQVAHLQQYEIQYMEWRIKAERLESDITQLQRMVADKDAELAHGYRLLEASAAERSRLRHAYQESAERAKALAAQLAVAEAKAAQLQAAPQPKGLLGASANGNGNSNNGAAAATSTPAAALPAGSDVQNVLEALSGLAKVMAEDMSHEVKSMNIKSHPLSFDK